MTQSSTSSSPPAKRPEVGRALRWFQRVQIMLLVSLASLVLMEGLARLALDPPPVRPHRTGQPFGRKIPPPLGYELIPNSQTRWDYPGMGPDGEAIEIRATINNLGYRDPPRSLEKPVGTRRLLCVGDSFTFGTGVQDEETLPRHLKTYFQSREKGRNFEIWNCGVPGFDIVQETALIEERLLQADPDAILLTYYINDIEFADYGDPDPLPPIELWIMRACGERPRGWAKSVRSVSRLAEVLARRFYVKLGTSHYAQSQASLYAEHSKSWIAMCTKLRYLRDLCSERGIRFALALYPTLFKGKDGNLASHGPYSKITKFCGEENITCLDLEPALVRLPLEHMWVHPLNMHPNGTVHRIAAHAVGTYLEGLGWLED